MPTRNIPIDKSVVAMGRLMKGSETFIALLRGVAEIFQYACLAVGCMQPYQGGHGLTTGILKDDWGYTRSTLEVRFPDATAVYGKLRIELTVKRLRTQQRGA